MAEKTSVQRFFHDRVSKRVFSGCCVRLGYLHKIGKALEIVTYGI